MNNVVILNFSTRNNGNCANIAQYLRVRHPETNVFVYVIDDRVGPCGKCDYECLRAGAKCPNVTPYLEDIMKSVVHSDLTYLIIPNYCGFPCANYLAFNERSVGFFNMDSALMDRYMSAKKRFIIVSNSDNAVFDQAMRQQVKGEPDVLYLKSGKYGKRSIAGDILESDQARNDLEAFLQESSR